MCPSSDSTILGLAYNYGTATGSEGPTIVNREMERSVGCLVLEPVLRLWVYWPKYWGSTYATDMDGFN